MSGDQEQLCVVDSDTGQILYYFNSSTGEMNWVNQPPKEISDQTNTSKAPSPSESSVSDSEDLSEPEPIKIKTSPSSAAKIEPKECSNIVPGEVVTVILEPCPENGKKGRSGSSRVKLNKKAVRAVTSIVEQSPRKRKLEEGEPSSIPSKAAYAEQAETHKVREFVCKYCKKLFPSKTSLSKHIDTHLGPKPYKCPRCYKGFRNPRNLATHANMHILSRPYVCVKCGKSFSTGSCLTVHMSRHDGIPPYTCQHCSKGFNHFTALTLHLATHLPYLPCRCAYCQQECANPKELSRHLQTHKPKAVSGKVHKKPSLSCQFCSMSFANHKSLEVHLVTKHGTQSKEASNRSVNPLRQLQALIFKETPTYEANRVNQMRNSINHREMVVNRYNTNSRSHISVAHPSNSVERSDSNIPIQGSSIARSGGNIDIPKGSNDVQNHAGKSGDPLSQLRALTYRRDGPISEVSTLPPSGQRQQPLYSNAHSASSGGLSSLPTIKQEKNIDEGVLNEGARSSGDVNRSTSQGDDIREGEGKLLPCLDCNEVFTSSADLAVHARIHNKSDLIECTQCERNFVQESEFRKHLVSHEGKAGTYVCPKCGKTFVHSHGLNLHLRIHTGEKPFQCKHCLKCFAHSGNLTVHLRTHTGEKPFKCQYCHQAFNHSSNLKNHMRLHTGEKPYQCKFCDRSFSRSSHLRNHIINHTLGRTDPDIFRCDICDKPFNDVALLNEHMKLHNETKPHICRFCGKAFTVPSGLAVHERTHTGEKPYKCKYCDRAFSHSSNMKVHVRTHTGEKPYHCKVCDTTFARSSDLRRHVYFQGCQKLATSISGIPSGPASVGEPVVNVPVTLQGLPVRTYPSTVTYSSYVGADYGDDKQEREKQDANPFQRIKEHIKALSGNSSASAENTNASSTSEANSNVNSSGPSMSITSNSFPSQEAVVEKSGDAPGTISDPAKQPQTNASQPPPFLLSTLALKPATRENSFKESYINKESEDIKKTVKVEDDDRVNSHRETASVDDETVKTTIQSLNHSQAIIVSTRPPEVASSTGSYTGTLYGGQVVRKEGSRPAIEGMGKPSLPTAHTKIYASPWPYKQSENATSLRQYDTVITGSQPYIANTVGNSQPYMVKPFSSSQPYLAKSVSSSMTYMAKPVSSQQLNAQTMSETVAFSKPPVLEVEVVSTPVGNEREMGSMDDHKTADTMLGKYTSRGAEHVNTWQSPSPNSANVRMHGSPITSTKVVMHGNSDSEDAIGSDTIIETSSLQPLQALTESILPKFS